MAVYRSTDHNHPTIRPDLRDVAVETEKLRRQAARKRRWLARREAWERVVAEYRQQLAESCQKTKGFSCGRAYALLKQVIGRPCAQQKCR